MTQPPLFRSIMILSNLEEESQGKILVVLSENICARLLPCLELHAVAGCSKWVFWYSVGEVFV